MIIALMGLKIKVKGQQSRSQVEIRLVGSRSEVDPSLLFTQKLSGWSREQTTTEAWEHIDQVGNAARPSAVRWHSALLFWCHMRPYVQPTPSDYIPRQRCMHSPISRLTLTRTNVGRSGSPSVYHCHSSPVHDVCALTETFISRNVRLVNTYGISVPMLHIHGPHKMDQTGAEARVRHCQQISSEVENFLASRHLKEGQIYHSLDIFYKKNA